MTRDELEAMTKAQIIARFGLDADRERTTKENLIDLALRQQRKEPEPEPRDDDAVMLALLLDNCTFTFRDAGGQVHTVNPGRPHTVALAGFPEALARWPAEWADVGGGDVTVHVDGELATHGRFVHASERKG